MRRTLWQKVKDLHKSEGQRATLLQDAQAMVKVMESICAMESVDGERESVVCGLLAKLDPLHALMKQMEDASAKVPDATAIQEKIATVHDTTSKLVSWVREHVQKQGEFIRTFKEIGDEMDKTFVIPDGEGDKIGAEYTGILPKVPEGAARSLFILRCPLTASGSYLSQNSWFQCSVGITRFDLTIPGSFHASLPDKMAAMHPSVYHALVKWINTTRALESAAGDGNYSFEQLQKAVKYVGETSVFFEGLGESIAQINTSTQGEKPSRAVTGPALHSIVRMLERMQTLCTKRAVKEMVSDGLQGKDFKTVLPEKFHSLAHALQTEWAKELQALEGEPSIEFLGEKASLSETALSCTTSSLWNEDMFAAKRAECKAYVRAFSLAVTRAMEEQLGPAYRGPMENFLEKYKGVLECLQQWKLKDIEWIYKKEADQEVKDDLNSAHRGTEAALAFSKKLEPLCLFRSQSTEVQTALNKCKDLHKTLADQAQQCALIATNMILSTLAIDENQTVELLEKTEKFTKKVFNLGRECLPEKVQEQLKTLKEKSEKSVKSARSSQQTGKEKDKKDHKKKEKDKDKEKKHHKRHRSSESDEAQPKKEKKERKHRR